jgi:type I thyroxine 5'-deiodinase
LTIPKGVEPESARSPAARVEFANTCVATLKIDIPALLDGKENATERAYTGWPSRIYLVGADGRIRFKGAPGPYGFSAKELEDAIKRESSSATTA